jgi:homoserine dehydrogenase
VIRASVLGCGVVGGGVVKLIREHHESLARRVGAPVEVVRVLERDRSRTQAAGVDDRLVTDNPSQVLDDPSIDVVVEVMGGVEPALTFVERAIRNKKSVVTANKMLLAAHGGRLLALAREFGVDLAFEASVGGGIPILRVLRDALAGDRVEALSGIVNGTCNFMLTRMCNDGLSFDEALREAQAKGFAEAEPSLDVDGHDAAHKLVVLATLAFGAKLDGFHVFTEGIRAIEPIDHRFAERWGFRIKHLAIGADCKGALELRVHPALVSTASTLASVGGVLNAIALQGAALGPALLSGRGAGERPTAVSVVGDVADVARAKVLGVPGMLLRGLQLVDRPVLPIDDVQTRYYLRFQVFDRPGVLARITGALGDARVSIEQMVQEGRGNETGAPVQVVMLTHAAKERDVRAALQVLGVLDFVAKPVCLIRVHDEAAGVA